MKFVVSSTELLSHLAAISKVINSKNTLPILDNYLFLLEDNRLTVTASDLESTLITSLELDNTSGTGTIAVPAKLMNETLKEFPEQPLTFQIDPETFAVDIFSQNGKFSIVGQNGEDFPQQPMLNEGVASSINLNHHVLLSGINKTLFATADDELRPVMNGIFIELSTDDIKFVASDAHKLVRYKRFDAKADKDASFILPKKPAALLKSLLPKEDFDVKLEFDDKNAFFTLSNYKLICRLVEGNYPSYNSVIPSNNPNKLIIDRIEFYNTVRRVSVFSNQASNLVRLKLTENQLVVSAQDIDFSISGVERLNCQYEGDEMEIGFKSTFLQEILSNLSASDVKVELSDPTRAGLLLPAENENEEEDVLMLLMPMMINA
ncbi:MAG: DNA polymerase III subunit beta [Prolixibacteraceae bacterium]